tara:strand:+ start:5714 stop:6163 length:450 start_codon:yes stop_codon:yes gene_type:complete
MKTDGFVKLLRKVIREEVSNAIKAELKPILNEVRSTKHDITLQEIASTPTRASTSNKKKQYTKNSMLNDLLNETAAVATMDAGVEWNTPKFKSNLADAIGMNPAPRALATSGINGEAVNMNNEAVASTVNAMTKDYSALMKAIDKKKGK